MRRRFDIVRHKGQSRVCMIRFLLRALAVLFLAVTVIFAVVDVTRSVGASTLTMTPLADSWDGLAPGTREAFGAWLASALHPLLGDPVLATFAGWPTFIVSGGLALLLALAGGIRRRRKTRMP